MDIVGISGKKQSGKNTTANIMVAYILKKRGFIKDFYTDTSGSIYIEGRVQDINLAMLSSPVQLFSFAESLKNLCIELFELQPQQCYGSEEEKSSEAFRGMTARQVMQKVGASMREIHPDVWINKTLNDIDRSEECDLAIITDCRYLNEVEAIKKNGGTIIRLTRQVSFDDHASETELDDYDGFDYVIDNAQDTIEAQSEKIFNLMSRWYD